MPTSVPCGGIGGVISSCSHFLVAPVYAPIQLFHPLIVPGAWLVAAWLLHGLSKTAWARGHLGELLVKLRAWRGLSGDTYQAFHNVTLRTPAGTTQIDHVFVSVYGVFVLETKHMRGVIQGSERQPRWTQAFGQKRFEFQNPLRQNYKHLKALEVVLGLAPEHLHSLVVFTGSARFKGELPANVVRGGAFVRYIKTLRTPLFTQAQANALAQTLRQRRLAPTRATHRAHVAQLKRRGTTTATPSCPECGEPMRLRTARGGTAPGAAFWGCSSFPECRGTQKL